MVPVAVAGLAFAATILGLPIAIAMWAIVVIVVRDSTAILRGEKGASRRLAMLCRAMAWLGGVLLGLTVLFGYDDLFGHAINVVGLATGILWVVVVAQAAQVASLGTQPGAA